MSVTTPPPPPPPAPQAGATSLSVMPVEPPRRPWWLAKRVIAGAVGIVLLSGAATAVLALSEVSRVVEALRQSKPVKLKPNTLAPASQGAPETLLLVGNDERPPPKSNPGGAVEPHSNEMLLVRIDPSKPTISMLSIPRELQVTFTAPNGAVITNRINSAYTYGYEEGGGTAGGVQLMLETIKRVLGVTVNHVVVTNFPKFKRAVDELGCVYMTVDRRYYHVNEPGGEQYFEINLQPGYQRLCGQQALEFVANRHEDTSLTRDARDQRFLLSVKGQYGPSALEGREKLERIFGKAVETDTALHSSDQVLQLLELLAESAGKPVRQVPFHVNLLPTYDTASEQQIKEAVRSFLRGTAAIHEHTPIPQHPSSHPPRGTHHNNHHVASATTLGMTLTPASMLREARSIAARLPFAVQAPRYQFTNAAAGPDLVHRYDIRGAGRRLYPAYVIVVDRGGLGEYYDVQGTTWTAPPLLSGPTATVHAGARTYDLFYDGEHIKTIAWHEREAVYWIENTLTNGVSPLDMVALAQETLPVTNRTANATTGGLHTPLGNLELPNHSSVSSASLTDKAGAGVAILVIITLAGLSILLLRRQRELGHLREQVAHALTLEANQRYALAAAIAPRQADRHGKRGSDT
jgi:LCP family protein required for cell wall assembly